MDRIQNAIKFILVHKLFFQNQTSYRFACLNCLFCDIRSLLISKMGADCSDNTYTVFYQITASFFICRNSYNTIIYQCLDCIANPETKIAVFSYTVTYAKLSVYSKPDLSLSIIRHAIHLHRLYITVLQQRMLRPSRYPR